MDIDTLKNVVASLHGASPVLIVNLHAAAKALSGGNDSQIHPAIAEILKNDASILADVVAELVSHKATGSFR